MRFVLLFLAVCGIVVSALALHVHYSTDQQPCSINEKWDCGIVNHSRFAEIEHVPVAAIGIFGYTLLGVLAVFRRNRLLALMALIGLGFSLYLTNIEARQLQVWCLYCVISQGIIALITLLAIAAAILQRRESVTV